MNGQNDKPTSKYMKINFTVKHDGNFSPFIGLVKQKLAGKLRENHGYL